MGLISAALRRQALSSGRGATLWRRFGCPSIDDWGEYLRRHGGFYSFGEGCWINPGAYFADPAITSIGNNVHITGGFLTGHDGSVNMLNRAFGTKLDAVGPIKILDDVYIGYGAIVLPGVTIGPRSIVGAGSVVSRDIPENVVAAGVPAKFICSLDSYVEKLKLKNAGYPWMPHIEGRNGEFDAAIEPELVRMRQAHFFED